MRRSTEGIEPIGDQEEFCTMLHKRGEDTAFRGHQLKNRHKKRSILKDLRSYKNTPMAGAEGLEPSARGFGAAVGKRKSHQNCAVFKALAAIQNHF